MTRTFNFLIQAIIEFFTGILTSLYFYIDEFYVNFNGLLFFFVLFSILMYFIPSLISKGGKSEKG